jgi:hypothetical protein
MVPKPEANLNEDLSPIPLREATPNEDPPTSSKKPVPSSPEIAKKAEAELLALRAIRAEIPGLGNAGAANEIKQICRRVDEVISDLQAGRGTNEGVFALSDLGERLCELATPLQDFNWACSVGKDQKAVLAIAQQAWKLEEIGKALATKQIGRVSPKPVPSAGRDSITPSVPTDPWASAFKMRKGHFSGYNPSKGCELAMPTAVRLLECLPTVPNSQAPTGAKQILESDFLKSRDYRYEPVSWKKGIGFRDAQGVVSHTIAVHLLASALGYEDSYWFPKYAKDKYVTSDGLVVRWQSVELYENSDDRTCFNGLWQWELRRSGREQFFLTLRRISVDDATTHSLASIEPASHFMIPRPAPNVDEDLSPIPLDEATPHRESPTASEKAMLSCSEDDATTYSLESIDAESHVSPTVPPWHLAPSSPQARERPSGRGTDEASVWMHRVMDRFPKGVTVILLDMPSAKVADKFINLLKFFWDENGDAQGFRYPSGEILLGLAGNMTEKCIYEILFNAIEGGYKYTNIANGNNVPAMKSAMQILRIKGYSVEP